MRLRKWQEAVNTTAQSRGIRNGREVFFLNFERNTAMQERDRAQNNKKRQAKGEGIVRKKVRESGGGSR